MWEAGRRPGAGHWPAREFKRGTPGARVIGKRMQNALILEIVPARRAWESPTGRVRSPENEKAPLRVFLFLGRLPRSLLGRANEKTGAGSRRGAQRPCREEAGPWARAGRAPSAVCTHAAPRSPRAPPGGARPAGAASRGEEARGCVVEERVQLHFGYEAILEQPSPAGRP